MADESIMKKFPVIGWIKTIDQQEAAQAIMRLNMDDPMALYAFQYHFRVVTEPVTTDAEYALLWANGMSFKDILKRMRAEANRGQS